MNLPIHTLERDLFYDNVVHDIACNSIYVLLFLLASLMVLNSLQCSRIKTNLLFFILTSFISYILPKAFNKSLLAILFLFSSKNNFNHRR